MNKGLDGVCKEIGVREGRADEKRFEIWLVGKGAYVLDAGGVFMQVLGSDKGSTQIKALDTGQMMNVPHWTLVELAEVMLV